MSAGEQDNVNVGLPRQIKLTDGEAAKLRAINDKVGGIQQWVQMVAAQGERRMAEVQAEGRETWKEIAAKYGIDLERVNYDLAKDGATIIPVAMKLR